MLRLILITSKVITLDREVSDAGTSLSASDLAIRQSISGLARNCIFFSPGDKSYLMDSTENSGETG